MTDWRSAELEDSGAVRPENISDAPGKRMRFHLSDRDSRYPIESLLECLKIDGHIAGLLVGQTEIGHVGFRLHGRGSLDPMNQVLRFVGKFTGDKSAVRPMIKRRPDHSLRVGDSGNDVALATTELLDDSLALLRRADSFGAVNGELGSSDTTGEEPDGSDHQPQSEDPLLSVHRSLRCGSVGKMFPQRPLWRIAGILWGLILAFIISGPLCFSQQTPTPPDGKQIFLQHCAECHGEHGEGVSAAVSYMGPSLQAEHNPGDVMAAMEIGPEHMPRFSYILTGDQMRAVAKYVTESLAVIPLTGGNLSDGGELYRTYCASCHRTDVRGGALGFVGTNAPSLVDKSPALIAGAIRWGPGPMPSFPASVLSDQQVASIVDYTVKMQHPPSPGGSAMNWYGPVAEGYAAWVAILILVLFCVWAEWGGKG